MRQNIEKNKLGNFMEIKNILCYDINWVDAVCRIRIRRKNDRILNLLLEMLLESNERELSVHGE